MHKSKECVTVGFAGEEKSNHPKTLVKQWVHTQVKVKVMHRDQRFVIKCSAKRSNSLKQAF